MPSSNPHWYAPKGRSPNVTLQHFCNTTTAPLQIQTQTNCILHKVKILFILASVIKWLFALYINEFSFFYELVNIIGMYGIAL